jgi:hypothetical protein
LSKGGGKMDRISCLAYLLYHFNDEKCLKDAAILLLNGDVNLKQLKKNKTVLPFIIEVEQYLKENVIDKSNVAAFIEEFLLVEV